MFVSMNERSSSIRGGVGHQRYVGEGNTFRGDLLKHSLAKRCEP